MGTADPLQPPSLSGVVSRSGVGWYPLGALGALALTGVVVGHAVLVLLPDIARTVGIGTGGLTAMLTAQALLAAFVALPLARLVQHRALRAVLATTGAATGGLLLVLAALAVRPAELVLALLAVGAAGAVVAVAHQPLVAEHYPPDGRVRVLAVLGAARGAGEVVGPLAVGAMATVLGLTWRGVFVVVGAAGLAAAVAALRLRDPGFGCWDGGSDDRDVRDDLTLPEAVRRLHAIPSLRRLYTFQAGLGVALVPLVVLLQLFLDVEWNLGPAGRGIVLSLFGVAAVVGVTLFGRVGERWLQQDARRLVVRAAMLWGVAVALIPVGAFAPSLVLVVLMLASAVGLTAAIGPGLAALHLSLVPPRLRSMSTALAAVWFAGVGGPLGVLLFGSVDRRVGLAGALALTALPGAAGVLLLLRARQTVVADLQTRADAAARPRPSARSALVVVGLATGYDGRDVVHGLDLAVAAGECVGLIGANGAGKTTVLHALAGVGAVSAGTVWVDDRDVTHRDAGARVQVGLVLVAGTGSVVAPLTVEEHLQLYAHHAVGLAAEDRGRARDDALARFPVLRHRLHVLARELSGGEQRMLGLARIPFLRPRVLLVDELTLGLAEDTRVQATALVREAVDRGAASVLVDQSVDEIRGIADRIVVLADGQVVHDGPAATFDRASVSARHLSAGP